jgi:hypothetical protein
MASEMKVVQGVKPVSRCKIITQTMDYGANFVVYLSQNIIPTGFTRF